MMCHIEGIYLKFSTNHQNPYFGVKGENPNYLKKSTFDYLYNVCQSAYNNSSKVFQTQGVGEGVKVSAHPIY